MTNYRHGEVDVKFQQPALMSGNVRMDYLQMISSGTWFVNRGHMTQVKLWEKAISHMQIKNNIDFKNQPSFIYL